jgi:uncharacterized protein (DUF697 family)
MHDIDRTRLEMSYGAEEYEYEPEYEGYDPEYDQVGFEASPGLYGGATFGSPFTESKEMELAAELLGVTDEAELDQFFGNAFRLVRGFARSPVGRALGGALKPYIKKALPIAGAAIGTAVAPGVGTALGGALGSMAGKMFGLELEGLSPEDQEFEVARRFVRLAGDAAHIAASTPPNGASPQAVAQRAIVTAAQKHAPGLVAGMRQQGQRRGVWMRRGRNIVLYGV